MKIFSKTLLVSLVTLCSAGTAHAAAFQLAEVSTSGLGRAYAGDAAVADNASVVATNPALMTLFKQTELSAGGIVVNADVDVDGTLGGVFKASQKNIIPTAVVPNLYIVSPINDRFAIGGGVNVNYGLKSRFAPDYAAGVYGGNTQLQAINFNLSGAYNLGYGFSAGAGLNVIYSKAEFIRHLGVGGKILGSRLEPLAANAAKTLAQMQNGTEVSRVHGDEWSLGWNAGLMYEINERNRLGIAYHSAVNVKFKGHYSNAFPTAFNGLLAIPAIAAQSPISQATGGQEIPGRLTLHLPAYWEISGYHKLTDKLAMQYSYKRTEWEKFKALTAYGESGNVLLHKEENYNDSSRVALGFSYDVNEALTLRTGIAYDETASVRSPSISIPDTDRTWYTVGATYRFTPNLSADLGYAHLRGSKNTFKEGSAVFNVKSRANLYGLNVNYKF
ncbi:outer membrane protein transport protein [Mannheimia bovis]|uniref:outer membrane protein transport protein n=1 Tax=Mannheimia bovis TaxID=2770636 RepID=UPI0024B77770|nr:porin [Mannheimia bovis]WHP46280.1 outer membrane protein transport protein [Mannheimia bovis]